MDEEAMGNNARLTALYAGPERGAGKEPIESGRLIAGVGLSGDSHAGSDPDRQISLFASETLSVLLSEGFSLTAGELSANLFTEGLPLDEMMSGTRLRIGDAEIELSTPRSPCRSLTQIDHRLPKRLYRKCGWLGRVVKGGEVRTGAKIEVIDAPLKVS